MAPGVSSVAGHVSLPVDILWRPGQGDRGFLQEKSTQPAPSSVRDAAQRSCLNRRLRPASAGCPLGLSSGLGLRSG